MGDDAREVLNSLERIFSTLLSTTESLARQMVFLVRSLQKHEERFAALELRLIAIEERQRRTGEGFDA